MTKFTIIAVDLNGIIEHSILQLSMQNKNFQIARHLGNFFFANGYKCRQARKGQSKQCGQKICINQRSAVNWRNRSRRLVGRVMENLPEEA
ncbi:hypothetical protein T03_1566 [Trichinella britovi]|uniref:Uncharacterized protein n=1 Tax=Trichinella britovi TaxID=45882 RepID=A0A0V1D9N8_TRIBR|nr:hypothetical protein T03_1566 [Trichinella britovi]